MSADRTTRRRAAIEEIADECIAVRVRILNRVITGIYEQELRDSGFTAPQMNILVTVAKLGRAKPADVCRMLELDASTLSRNLVRMVELGWVRRPDDPDGRAAPIEATDAGLAALEKVLPDWRRAQKAAARVLGDQGLAAIRKTVKKLGLRAPE